MTSSIPCPDCTNDIPESAQQCPHCGRPGIFWNVIAAEKPDEVAALEARYKAAQADASSRKADAAVQDFENSVTNSHAVLARNHGDLLPLVTSTRRIYASYYQELQAGIRFPAGDQWDVVRELTDDLLFPNYKQHIRFAALTLDGIGLSNYGDCSITLRDGHIAHRASILEENSVMFLEHHHVEISRKAAVPKGFRATWKDRAKLCVAKVAPSIDSTTTPDKYSGLLLNQGLTSEHDSFVEVHIYGPLTVLSMEQVIVTAPKARQRATILKAVNSKLAKHGVLVK